jgi:glycosyltransferase involved in cell wall biosynthesis
MVPHPRKIVNLMQKIVYASTGRFILRSSKKVIVLNSRVKAFLIGRGINEARIVFLPNGVDTKAFSPSTEQQKRALRRRYNLPEDKILALFVGRFVPKKGFTKLLRVEAIKNLELVFAGGNAPDGYTRDDQHFLGAISRKHAPDVFRMCDIFVLPSQGEGFPVTIQEAMASGLSVIMTDDPAYDPYGLDESLVKLVEPNTKSVTIALQATVDDFQLQQEMARYSRAYALEHFDLSTNITQLLSIYRGQIG